MKVYTSCYKKIMKRHKAENDVYVKISKKSPYFSRKNKNFDGILMFNLIDADFGHEFGSRTTLEYYKQNLELEDLEKFYNWLDKSSDKNYFLLCFEELDTFYTKKDERRNFDVKYIKAGENKKCHRTYLAEKLNEVYHLDIVEYQEGK